MLVPGSHTQLTTPEQFEDIRARASASGSSSGGGGDGFVRLAVATEAPAGTALVFDGRLLHGTGTNTTQDNRHGLFMYYCKGWMRQRENVSLSLSPTPGRTVGTLSRPLCWELTDL